jgi:hypothetical protein
MVMLYLGYKNVRSYIIELVLKIHRSRLDINEYCSDLINKVDIFTETRIQEDKEQIDRNAHRKQWLKEIQEYEQVCVKKMEATRDKLIESVEKVKDWTKTRMQFFEETNERDLSHLAEQTESHLEYFRNLFLQMRAIFPEFLPNLRF